MRLDDFIDTESFIRFVEAVKRYFRNLRRNRHPARGKP